MPPRRSWPSNTNTATHRPVQRAKRRPSAASPSCPRWGSQNLSDDCASLTSLPAWLCSSCNNSNYPRQIGASEAATRFREASGGGPQVCTFLCGSHKAKDDPLHGFTILRSHDSPPPPMGNNGIPLSSHHGDMYGMIHIPGRPGCNPMEGTQEGGSGRSSGRGFRACILHTSGMKTEVYCDVPDGCGLVGCYIYGL